MSIKSGSNYSLPSYSNATGSNGIFTYRKRVTGTNHRFSDRNIEINHRSKNYRNNFYQYLLQVRKNLDKDGKLRLTRNKKGSNNQRGDSDAHKNIRDISKDEIHISVANGKHLNFGAYKGKNENINYETFHNNDEYNENNWNGEFCEGFQKQKCEKKFEEVRRSLLLWLNNASEQHNNEKENLTHNDNDNKYSE